MSIPRLPEAGTLSRESSGIARKLALAAAFLASILIGLAATPARAAERLSIMVSHTPLSLPIFIAQDKGYVAAQGLEVTLQPCVGGHRCMRQMLNGEADLATAGDMPITINSFERSDFAVLATMASTGDDMKLVAHDRSGITAPSHLAGKRIGAVIGAASQYFLELYLLTAGIDPRQLSVVGLQPEEMAPALLSGKVDAISIWEPYGYQALKALGPHGVALPNVGAYFQSFNIVCQRRMVGSRDPALVQLLRAVERAERFIQEQPEEAKAVLRARLEMDPAFLDRIWPGLGFRLSLDPSLLATMEAEVRWARREGHVKAGRLPNLPALLHAAPLRAIKPTAVNAGVR
jgi:NitT/TauT family transport system substrate-binding protein